MAARPDAGDGVSLRIRPVAGRVLAGGARRLVLLTTEDNVPRCLYPTVRSGARHATGPRVASVTAPMAASSRPLCCLTCAR